MDFASMMPDGRLNKSQLLEAVDMALYSAKSDGRNRIAHAPNQAPVIKGAKPLAPAMVPSFQTTH